MLIDQLQACYESLQPDLLQGVRAKAWDHFLELGLPDKSAEAFRYFPLRRLYELRIDSPEPQEIDRAAILPYIYPECHASYIVFINGRFIPKLSNLTALPQKIVVLPINEASRSYGSFLQSRFSQTLKEELDPFAVLNLAIHDKGVFFYIPPKTVIETPIQTLSLTTGENCLSASRIHLFLAPQAKAQWISTQAGPGLHNSFLDVNLEEGASFKHLNVPRLTQWHLNYLRATLKQDSSLQHLAINKETQTGRHSLRASLQGERADALLQGLWHLEKNSQIHTHVEVEHAAPHTRSLQKFKGILNDHAQSSFEGKILVRPVAQKTEAYQLNNNLLLSDHAIACAKPNLEIFADDVKASHGATMVQLDEEHLFYLKSRGISDQDAKRLLISGFLNEMIAQIPIPSIREASYV